MKRLLIGLSLCAALLGWPAAVAGGAGAGVRPATTVLPVQTPQTRTYSNPVLNDNVPDPFVLRVGQTYYLYVTNGPGGNVPVFTSTDLVNWKVQGDALPDQPTWALPGTTWAPEVMAYGQNRYVLYYTTRDYASDKQCVGAAVAASPAGPYLDSSDQPIVCQTELGGSIDPSPFQDADGERYLLWKNDGNCCNLPTTLFIQKLSQDGLTLHGQPTALIRNDQPWEGSVVEAPTLHLENGTYYLLYSGGSYNSATYGVGYATSKKLPGSYRKSGANPLVRTRGEVVGPGHQSLINDAAGQMWLFYHAWTLGAVGDGVGIRNLRLDKISFGGGQIKFAGPTLTPQVAPITGR